MTHPEVADFLTALMGLLNRRGLASTFVLESCGISRKELKAYLLPPFKKGAMLIPPETLATLIAAVQMYVYEQMEVEPIRWHIEHLGNYYYEVLDADGQHVLFHTVYSRALEVADQYHGSVRNHGRAPTLMLDQYQSLRSRWRRAIHARSLDLDEVCKVTGYNAHRVVTTGHEEFVFHQIAKQPDEAAVIALEELANRQRFAA